MRKIDGTEVLNAGRRRVAGFPGRRILPCVDMQRPE
jgi:hypothetical protein